MEKERGHGKREGEEERRTCLLELEGEAQLVSIASQRRGTNAGSQGEGHTATQGLRVAQAQVEGAVDLGLGCEHGGVGRGKGGRGEVGEGGKGRRGGKGGEGRQGRDPP